MTEKFYSVRLSIQRRSWSFIYFFWFIWI